MGVRVSKRGAIANGRGSKAIDAVTDDAEVDIADEAYQRVRAHLNASLKHPTGYYESRIHVSNLSSGLMISDGGVVYGPWLEGTSSRNNSTRFKGYHTFRKVMQEMDKTAEDIAERKISQELGRLG